MQFNKDQIKDLALGSAAIFFVYLLGGVLQEHLVARTYVNDIKGGEKQFPFKMAIIMAPAFVTWIFGNIYNRYLPDRNQISQKSSFNAALCLFVSISTFTYAINLISFPVAVAIKSCSLLSVILVSTLCQKLRSGKKQLTLGPKKIILGILTIFGLFLSIYFYPQKIYKSNNAYMIGIPLMVISLIADGLMPDFQSVIRCESRPHPTEMMQKLNKWVCLICLCWIVVSLEVKQIVIFMMEHKEFSFQLFLFSLLAFFGQVYVHRMTAQFKYNITRSVVSIRKLLSVILSLMFYHHLTSNLQIAGLLLIFGTILYEFAGELRKQGPRTQKFQQVEEVSEQVQTERGELHSHQQI